MHAIQPLSPHANATEAQVRTLSFVGRARGTVLRRFLSFMISPGATASWRLLGLPVVWLLVSGVPAHSLGAAVSQSLDGTWRFQLDRADAGIGERWFERKLPEKFKLPGSLPAAGIGDAPSLDTKWTGGIQSPKWYEEPRYAPYAKADNFKFPFWLQPEKYYAGVAWFQREIEIPKDWEGKRVVLFLERVHWESRVWVDGRCVGTNNSLSTPHEYELGVVGRARLSERAEPISSDDGAHGVTRPTELAPGKHTVSIRVDNRRIVDIGENSHAITDHTQGNWNGIVGKIELRTTPLVWIEDVMMVWDERTKSLVRMVSIGNATGQAGKGVLSVDGKETETEWNATDGADIRVVALGDAAKTWDEFHPELQHFKFTLRSSGVDTREASFGLRKVSTAGTQITINGRKTFIRGTLECAIFPKTGHPPMEVEEWRRIIRVAKSYGLNLLRFHSYCPPEAAFQAADELGFYFQVETCWPNQSTTLGDGKPVDQWIYDETDRILKYYGNHPSFILMAHGNEPGGGKANAYLAKYVEHFKAKDPRRLWTSGSGWPQLPENQFHVTPDPRVQGWGEGLKSRINARPPETTTDYRDYIAARKVPVISHEIGQWCVYPNFAEIPKYTGYLKPKNFEVFRDLLDRNGMGGLAKQFLLASGKLQTLCYKEDIESALRTPGMGGFELLDLHDFPGQGTALVGVLDPFWEEKGYVTAKEYSRFCNSIVPLARLKKRVFTTDETLEAEIEVAHFGPSPIRGISSPSNGIPLASPLEPRGKPWEVIWYLQGWDGTKTLQSGFTVTNIPTGSLVSVGKITIPLANVRAPARCKLFVRFDEQAVTNSVPQTINPIERVRSPYSFDPDAGGRPGGAIRNDWDIWVYPAQPKTEPAKDILVTAQFDDAAQRHLASGGKLLLTLPGKAVRNFEKEPVKLGFSSIFWNTAWTGRQAPTTLGILCNPKHPALAEFPTEFHSNWQWWYLIHRAGALRLDLLPKSTEPIVRVIDDWFTARPLGLVVEGKVGAGKVVVCGFDLTRDADDPVSKQMRASLLAYMDSKNFAPKTAFTADQVKNLITDPRRGAMKGVRSVKASSAQEGYEAEAATDGDPATMWHTAWDDQAAGFPHELVVEFDAPRALTGLTALPRQDGNPNGWIKDYGVFVSRDGQNWTEVARGNFPRNAELKTVRFAQPATAKFLKLAAWSGHANGPWASVAELGVLSE